MNQSEIKQEVIKRYKYLYKNSQLILAPSIYEQTNEEFKEYNKKQIEQTKKRAKETSMSRKKLKEELNACQIKEPLIYQKHLNPNMLFLLEDFLFIDIPMEQSKLYSMIEYNQKDPKYLEKVQKGLINLEKYNQKFTYELMHIKLDIWNLLKRVYQNIERQTGDLKNKELKLKALDEYFRIARYTNDGRVWTSGYKLNIQDILNNIPNLSMFVPTTGQGPSREKYDLGARNNNFINTLANTGIFNKKNFHITEEEKQAIYLEFHDELPWQQQTENTKHKILSRNQKNT